MKLSQVKWQWKKLLYRAGIGNCPECGLYPHKLSCDFDDRERRKASHHS